MFNLVSSRFDMVSASSIHLCRQFIVCRFERVLRISATFFFAQAEDEDSLKKHSISWGRVREKLSKQHLSLLTIEKKLPFHHLQFTHTNIN